MYMGLKWDELEKIVFVNDFNDYINELKKNIDYFDFHNKNLTKEQEQKIEELKELIKCLKIIDK